MNTKTVSYLPKNKTTALSSQLKLFKDRAKSYLPNAKYVMFYHHHTKKLIAAPPEYALSSQISHAIDYASGMFEGGSAMVNETTGIPHVILHQPRLNRLFNRSLPSRGYKSPVSQAFLSQAILDIVAINGLELFQNPDPKSKNKYVRAYIRPTIHPAPIAGYGISMRIDYPIDAAIITWSWPDYLDPGIYTDGAVAAITGHQRLFKISGKNSSNYGQGVIDGTVVRKMGDDELIYLAPYLKRKTGGVYYHDPNDIDSKLKDGVLCDGPGEELFALSKDGQTLVYNPMKANRLGGTVLQYFIDHLLPALKLKSKRAEISLHDIRADKYSAIGMLGNAVKVAPIRKIKLYKEEKVIEEYEFYKKGKMPATLQILINRWDQETRGLVKPSHPSLTTPVNLKNGKSLRDKLDKIFH